MPPAVLRFLRDHGAETIPHPGGTLFEHVVRTAVTLSRWGCGPELVMAGLCHATYGTDGFPTALLPVDQRTVLEGLIGEAAEAIVYCYAASDRSVTWPGVGEPGLVAYRDRFTGAPSTLGGTMLRSYWTVTTANELDLVDRLPQGSDLLPVLQRGRDLLPAAAVALL
jgi:hypothetical protein